MPYTSGDQYHILHVFLAGNVNGDPTAGTENDPPGLPLHVHSCGRHGDDVPSSLRESSICLPFPAGRLASNLVLIMSKIIYTTRAKLSVPLRTYKEMFRFNEAWTTRL